MAQAAKSLALLQYARSPSCTDMRDATSVRCMWTFSTPSRRDGITPSVRQRHLSDDSLDLLQEIPVISVIERFFVMELPHDNSGVHILLCRKGSDLCFLEYGPYPNHDCLEFL